MESDLRPRLCFLTKGECGYGFHLHGERKKGGQFIRKVEPGSSADLSGLRPGDRVVEVNGDNVETETHHQVVHRICEVEHRTRLLVVDRETDDYLRSQGLACSEDLAIEMGTYSPRPSPMPTPTASPILKENGAISPASILMHLVKASSPRPSPMPTPTASPIPIENGPISPASILMHSAKAPAIPSPSPSPSLTHSPSTHTERSSTHTERSSTHTERSSMTSSSMTDTELPLDTSPELPETTVELLPRLCHLVKGGHGYGFNLHSGKTHRGQFIRSVDPGSTADRADVRPGDRLLEVNGVNIEGMRHSEVVAFIRAGGEEVSLLVVDQDTDDLFQRLGVIPTISHIKEVYVDEPITESTPPTPSPTTNLPAADHLPIIDITLTDHSITNTSPKLRTNGSSASQSSRDSTTQSEFSSSDVSIQVPEEDDRRVSDPYLENGLRLSPTAAEAKEKVKRNKKRAPPMDWSKKYEIFSNL